MSVKLVKVEKGRRKKAANTASGNGSDVNLYIPRSRK